MWLKFEYKRSYNYFSFHQFCSFKTGQTGSPIRSDRSALPADTTGQTGPMDQSDRSAQNRESAHSALKCTTRRTPSLGVSLHDLPPLCIPADELDTAGAEVHVRVSCNNIVATNPEYSNTQQGLPDQWV